jgi:hypothetical protein
MSRGRCTFRQRDVTAALKAVVAAGMPVAGVKIDSDGNIVLLIQRSVGDLLNELDTELADFEARHGQG